MSLRWYQKFIYLNLHLFGFSLTWNIGIVYMWVLNYSVIFTDFCCSYLHISGLRTAMQFHRSFVRKLEKNDIFIPPISLRTKVRFLKANILLPLALSQFSVNKNKNVIFFCKIQFHCFIGSQSLLFTTKYIKSSMIIYYFFLFGIAWLRTKSRPWNVINSVLLIE